MTQRLRAWLGEQLIYIGLRLAPELAEPADEWDATLMDGIEVDDWPQQTEDFRATVCASERCGTCSGDGPCNVCGVGRQDVNPIWDKVHIS